MSHTEAASSGLEVIHAKIYPIGFQGRYVQNNLGIPAWELSILFIDDVQTLFDTTKTRMQITQNSIRSTEMELMVDQNVGVDRIGWGQP
jgi:hypothetical protein